MKLIQRAFPLDIENSFLCYILKGDYLLQNLPSVLWPIQGLSAVFCHTDRYHFRCQFFCTQAQACRRSFRQHQLHKQNVKIKKALFYYYLENRISVVEERKECLMKEAGIEQKHLHVSVEILTSVLCFHPSQQMFMFAEKVIISSQEERIKQLIITVLQLRGCTSQKMILHFNFFLHCFEEKNPKNQFDSNFVFVQENIIFFSLPHLNACAHLNT